MGRARATVKGNLQVTQPSLSRHRRVFESAGNRLSAGAANRTRTCDPVITNDVLYQLSYCGGPNASLGQPPETPAPDIGHGPDWQEKRGPYKAFSSEACPRT